MDESKSMFPYCLYQKRLDVDPINPIRTVQNVNSSTESYTTPVLKPFEFIELIQEMESYVMIPTRLKDIAVDTENMPSFLADDTKTVHDVYLALIKIKTGLIELMANKIVADDQDTSATSVLNSMEEVGKCEAIMAWLKDHPEFASGQHGAHEWSPSPTPSPDPEGQQQEDAESVTSTASKVDLPQDHITHVLEIMQLFSEKLSSAAQYVSESYRKAFDLPIDDFASTLHRY